MNSSITLPLVVALMLYGACCLFLYIAQRSFIYFPTAASSNPLANDLRIARVSHAKCMLLAASLD